MHILILRYFYVNYEIQYYKACLSGRCERYFRAISLLLNLNEYIKKVVVRLHTPTRCITHPFCMQRNKKISVEIPCVNASDLSKM